MTTARHLGEYTGACLKYAGNAPFGSCYLQCVANLLAWQQVTDAAAAMCPTWGFCWPGGHALRGSNRWLAAVRSLYQIDIAQLHFRHFAEACAAERDSIARGYPAAATVDAWYLPSPYEHREHIAHCVLVVRSDGKNVWILDPMNKPEPASYGIRKWQEMRSADCADGMQTFFLTSGPRREPGGTELIRFLRHDIRAHQLADRQQCDAFLAFCERAGGSPLDVSEVAAERMYLGKLVRRAARDAPGLARVADGFVSLARRWYLAHSIGREAGGDNGIAARQARLVRELADREREAREQYGAVIDAVSGAASRASRGA
jgi:hypothetical protein